MNDYKIISDFGCDLPEHLLSQYDIKVIPTNLHIEEEDTVLSNEIEISDFYKKLREKKMIKTSAINMQTFKNVFEEYLANELVFEEKGETKAHALPEKMNANADRELQFILATEDMLENSKGFTFVEKGFNKLSEKKKKTA